MIVVDMNGVKTETNFLRRYSELKIARVNHTMVTEFIKTRIR